MISTRAGSASVHMIDFDLVMELDRVIHVPEISENI